jgi:hypothetical protein
MTRTDPLLLPDEADLRDLLERTLSGTTAPPEIGPHALRLGRRLRTRRRVCLAASAVVASAVAALILPAALGGGSATVVDPAGEPSSSATTPTRESPADENTDGWWSMPATDMVSAVEAILPDGVTVTSSGPLIADTPDGGPAVGWINATVAGPSGPGRLNVMLFPTIADAPTAIGSATPSATASTTESATDPSAEDVETGVGDGQASYLSCAAEHTGRTECTQLRNEIDEIIGRRLINHSGPIDTFEVTLLREGGIVYAAAANTLDDKWGRQSTASADQPPLTLDQLEDLVRNDTWVMPAT